MGSYRLTCTPLGWQRAAAFLNVRLVLVPAALQRGQHGRNGGVTERAERLASDVLGNARQQIEITHLTCAALDLPQNFVQPIGALAAGRTLAARLVAVEVQQVFGE